MDFYRLQMKEGSKGKTITDEALSKNRITSHIDYAGQKFLSLMPGTIVLIHKGSIPVALVKIKKRIPDDKIEKTSFGIDYEIEVVSRYNEAIVFFPELNELWQNIPFQGTFAKVDNDNATYNRIVKWYNLINNKKNMDKIRKLLEYKKQVIFQGPPGTGKTYLAKQISKEMTKASSQGDPMQKIDEFFKTFDASKQEFIDRNNNFNNLLNVFHSKFPLEKVKDLTLEEYVIGTGENDSFCWWLEIGLKPLGYYFPGTAKSYLIYWSEAKKDYSKHTRLVRDIEDNEEAMGLVANAIYNLLNKQDYNEFKRIFGNSLMLKLLHSYYPEKYFPINSWRIIDKVLMLFGVDGKGLNVFEKNLKLQELFEQKKKVHNSGATSYDFMLFLFEDIGVKGDISVDTKEIVSKGRVKLIQFHPAYTYEDFVRGITVRVNEEKHPEYIVENRVLADFAEEAINNPKAKYVLIIDEINRANLPAVLGELIYALEYRYDKNNSDETTVESMYSLADSDNSAECFTEGKKLMLPDNLFIIGTMNTADRSVGHIDYAIRRRFAFVDILPSIEPIESNAHNLFKKVSRLFIENVDDLDRSNPKLKKSSYLAPDFNPENVWIGHSYFMIKDKEREELKKSDDEILKLKLEFEIKPLLKEYLADGILLEDARSYIEEIDV